jgi:hypothetical protein
MELHVRRKNKREEREARTVPEEETSEGGGLLARRRLRREQQRLEQAAAEGRSITRRGRAAIAGLRERIPSASQLRAGASEAGTWAKDQLGEHAVALGVGALTAGVVAASLLPSSTGERRALAVGRKLRPLALAAGKRLTRAGRATEGQEALSAPGTPQRRKEAPTGGKAPPRTATRARGRPQARQAAPASSKARGGQARGARRKQGARKPSSSATSRSAAKPS